MDKISLPFRIVLIVALVFAVLWFLVLRPKPVTGGEPAATAPGVTGLANDVAKANKAVDASNAAAARSEGAANAVGGSSTTATTKPSATGAKPAATSAAAKPAKPAKSVTPAAVAKPAKPGLADDAAPGDPSRPLLASVDAGKVVVVLFWNKNAPDDRATRRALRAIDLHGGEVVASAVPIGDVGRYEAITRGAQILESPTVLVIGAGGKARAITGYTQAGEIDQAVSDIGGTGYEARKAFQHKGFAAVADDACKDFGYALEQKSNPPTTVAALSKALATGAVELGHSRDRMAKAKVTSADERKLKSALVAFADRDIKWVAAARSQLKAGAEPGTVFLTLVQRESDGNNAYVAAAKKLRVRGCYAGL
ncbi:MAG TPA: hypothetical protein VF087_00180 [Solirubrobacteraceae bacterium]